MKVMIALTLLLSSCATPIVSNAIVRDSSESDFRQLMTHDVSSYAASAGRDPLDGATGASSILFRVNKRVQGGVMIVGLDSSALGVFVGLNTPNEFINAPFADLRVKFTLADGSVHMVAPIAGGGTSMLFQSPHDVDVTALRHVALFVNQSAEWAQ